jgi:hypothetical protein
VISLGGNSAARQRCNADIPGRRTLRDQNLAIAQDDLPPLLPSVP